MKIRTLIYFILASSFALIFLTYIGFAQNKNEDIIVGKKIKIFSKIINEERDILISLPYGYGQSKKRYPVVYILDGSEYRVIASGGMMQYFGSSGIPQVISVYIPNTDRGRDMTISDITLDQLPNIGKKGGENFLRFITEELISYIDNNYQTTDYRIIVGYSASGGFVLNALISRPESFNAYIAASPSVFYGIEFIENIRKYFQSIKTLDKFLFVPYYDKDVKTTTLTFPTINKIIKSNFPKGFRYKVKEYKGYAHVPNTSLYDGLMELFKDWKPVKPPKIMPSNGFLDKDKSILVELKGEESDIRYTLDGTEPTKESVLYDKPIVISKPVTVKAKSFRGNLSESEIVTADFKDSQVFTPEDNINNLKSGLKYKYFERVWYNLPDTINLLPTKMGITSNFNIKTRTKDEGFLFQFDGFIKISKDGQYRFYMFSRAECKLFLGNKIVIDNAPQSVLEESSCELYLKSGYYQVKTLYTNAWYHGAEFKVSYEGPDIKKQEIPAGMLFHKEY